MLWTLEEGLNGRVSGLVYNRDEGLLVAGSCPSGRPVPVQKVSYTRNKGRRAGDPLPLKNLINLDGRLVFYDLKV